MLTQLQLLQSTPAIGMAIGAMTTPVIIQSSPSISTSGKTISSRQPATNSTPKPPQDGGSSIVAGAKIETVSGAAGTALVEYLAASDVKFYGAYWCSHCQQQKSWFGATAAAKLPDVECAADGENSQRQLCKDLKLFKVSSKVPIRDEVYSNMEHKQSIYNTYYDYFM